MRMRVSAHQFSEKRYCIGKKGAGSRKLSVWRLEGSEERGL